MMGTVAIVITSTLLLLWFLDSPYHHRLGGLRPTAMERTLGLLAREMEISGSFKIQCDPRGAANIR